MSEAVDLFLELAALPTPPGDEQAAADVVLRYLSGLGVEPDEDGFGNVYARIEPTAEGTPLFFCAHLDTVPPSGELRPVVEDGVIRNAGGTILGGDNKAAVAQMLEGVRRVLVENVPHAGIDLLFTRQDASEIAWRIVAPVLDDATPPPVYEPGTWGPAEAMAKFGPPNGWSNPQ